MATAADLQRMIGDLGRLGTVVSVDHAAARCRVKIGDILSGELPWLEARAGGIRTWMPPSFGEQVLVFSMEADLACGLVVAGIFSDRNPAPWADKDAAGIMFADGAYVAYDQATHELVAVLPSGGQALIEAPGGISLRGDVTVEGKVTASGDVVAGDTSLQNHRHDKVQAGGAISGKPVL